MAVLTPYVTYEDISIDAMSAIKPDAAVKLREAEVHDQTAQLITPALLLGVTIRAEPEVPAKTQRIEVSTAGTETLVTVIEILLPANKRAGTESFTVYQRKRRDLLRSPVHLLEIDLLRRGVRWPIDIKLPPTPYFYLPESRRPPPYGGDLAVWLRSDPAAHSRTTTHARSQWHDRPGRSSGSCL
ncbi:MAG: DUF4058 family protein [Chloroflexales bacterium]|nr:DUF4058 family protein [Chloroflexales bacterium]